MACSSIQTWTISSLITAFLELALAFLLLWLASITFIIAKFASIFDLHLPCSCNAFSQDRNSRVNGICIQRALVEQPSRKISALSRSVVSKFPFEVNCACQGSSSRRSVHEKSENEQSAKAPFNPMLAGKQTLDDDTCCYRTVGPKGDHFLNGRANLKSRDKETEITPADDQSSCGAGEESKDIEGKPLDLCGEGGSRSLTGLLEENSWGKELPGALNLYVKAMGNDDAALEDWNPQERTSPLIELDGPANSENGIDNRTGSLQVLDCPGDGDGKNSSPENDTEGFRNLKEALTVEREARIALYVELEKERNAAATAADEAMAMILRLQKEKASIEMEARQYKRMAEEKTIYDEVAIDILKQIIVRRETEKAALENEVELYRRRLLSDRIDKWERESCTEVQEHMNESNSSSHGGRNRHHENQEIVPQEKNFLSVDTRPVSENEFENGMQLVNKEADHRLENDLSIHDVHVVLDDIQLSRKNDLKDKTASSINLSSDRHEGSGMLYGTEEKGGLPFAVESASSMEDDSADISSSHENENPASGEQKVIKAGSILNTQGLPEEWLKRSPSNDLRTKSMIIRDNARMKLEEEVQCLTERLRVLEAGRENLIVSVESMKKGQIQLQLLEEIALQLREIRSSK